MAAGFRPTRVYLEVGSKRVFAAALDWPGWCRAGDTTTNFGAPGTVPRVDSEPLTAAAARRQAALVTGAWSVLHAVAAGAPGRLRKGPRGGGRDRDPMLEHVLGAEASYARKIGVKHRQPALGDTAAIKAMRADIVDCLEAARAGAPPVANGWPPRYAARRIAWHVLDHAWEIEDKSEREDG